MNVATTTTTSLRFGDWLIQQGLLDEDQLDAALNAQRSQGGRLGQVLTSLKMLSEHEVIDALSRYFSIEQAQLDDLSGIEMSKARILPESMATRFCLIVVGESDGNLAVAMADPLDVVAMDTVKGKLGRNITVMIGSEDRIRHAIDVIYHGSDVAEQRLRDLVKLEVAADDLNRADSKFDDLSTADITGEAAARKAPVIEFVDLLLSQAVKSRASDIHIEPQEESMMVRMRVDGVLRDMVPPSRKMQPAVVTRMKILARMDIAERRLPQDGRFKIRSTGHDIDVRVSAIPTIYGEKVVLRILDSGSVNYDVDTLGIDTESLEHFKLALSQPHGIVIVTGPTGSGKSTTLYSALSYLKDPRKNITTVEDPVEYRLKGINQIQVKPDIDLDFAACLRSILRQDPDIIMIGEIRDKETVEIAIKASLTGHLVLSTFHTNDAPSAISRLVYMGIDPYLLASSVNLILAQRLVRRICENCKEATKLDEALLRRLRIKPEMAQEVTFYQGRGCNQCGHTGYQGRLPIFELMPLSTDLREMLVQRASESQLRAKMREMGHDGLLESGVQKILEGQTTAEEVLSVTFTEDAT